MFLISLFSQFGGIPTSDELLAAIEEAPQKVAAYQKFDTPIYVKFVFDMYVFERPSQAQVKDLAERLKSVFEAKMAEDTPQSFQTVGFELTAKLVLNPPDLSMVN
jgi:hypothetical protein